MSESKTSADVEKRKGYKLEDCGLFSSSQRLASACYNYRPTALLNYPKPVLLLLWTSCSVCVFSAGTYEPGNKRKLRGASMPPYGNAPRNLICAFHALNLLSLIYPTWCVGVYGCEIRFPFMARIPHCSCQQEGENVWHDLARFSKPLTAPKQIQRGEERAVWFWAFSSFVHSVTSSFHIYEQLCLTQYRHERKSWPWPSRKLQHCIIS